MHKKKYSFNKKEVMKHLLKKSKNFRKWLNYQKYPESNLRRNNLVMDSLYFIIFLIIAFILYKNINLINEYSILFIKAGSVLLIIGTVLCVKYLYDILKNIRYAFKGMKNGYKLVFAIIFVLLLLYFNQEEYILKTKTKLDLVNLSNYNPIILSFFENGQAENLSIGKFEEKLVSELITNKTKDIEKNILKYVNVERKSRGKSELKWNEELAYIARAHSLDMAENNFFGHVNPGGDDATDRARKIGFNIKKKLGKGLYAEGVYENIGKISTGDISGIGFVSDDADSIAKAQVKYWMYSMEHRQNILNPQISDIGIGVIVKNGEYISTQVFW